MNKQWEEEIDVSEFRPTREYGAIYIPPEAYRSDALINKNAGEYHIYLRGNEVEDPRTNKR